MQVANASLGVNVKGRSPPGAPSLESGLGTCSPPLCNLSGEWKQADKGVSPLYGYFFPSCLLKITSPAHSPLRAGGQDCGRAVPQIWLMQEPYRSCSGNRRPLGSTGVQPLCSLGCRAHKGGCTPRQGPQFQRGPRFLSQRPCVEHRGTRTGTGLGPLEPP